MLYMTISTFIHQNILVAYTQGDRQTNRQAGRWAGSRAAALATVVLCTAAIDIIYVDRRQTDAVTATSRCLIIRVTR